MGNFFVYTIEGDPVALTRWRQEARNAYNEYRKKELEHSEALSGMHLDKGFLSGPLLLEVTFHFKIPLSWSRGKQKVFPSKYHIAAPGLTKCIEWVENVSRKIIFQNECFIAKITALKKYDRKPKTVFRIEEMQNK